VEYLFMTSPDYLAMATQITRAIRHCVVLDLQVRSASKGELVLELPYSQKIVGNPVTGTIHGGALTTLMDSVCGFSVPLALDKLQVCPTLDLRIDYMTNAEPGRSVYGSARVYRSTSNVMFVEGVAWQDDINSPIARCVATFMRLELPATETPHAFTSASSETAVQTETAQTALQGSTRQVTAIQTTAQTTAQTSLNLVDSNVSLADPEVSSERIKDELNRAREHRTFKHFIEQIPYAQQLGIECQCIGDEFIFRLPEKYDNQGNPFLPAIHGGATGGAMELAATLHVMFTMNTQQLPKVIDFSIDYLRAGRMKDIFIECDVVRQGRKIVNVSVVAWQSKRDTPIATARVHFLLI
jgi:uncharacterized protein (TIGR00369 family)